MSNNRKIIIFGSLISILLAVIGVIIFFHLKGPSPNNTLSGGSKGKGISFFAPNYFQSDPKSTNYVKYMTETFNGSKNTKATLAATSSTIADSTNAIAQLNKALDSRKGSYYLTFISNQGSFAKTLSATGPQTIEVSDINNNFFDLKKIATFTNRNIKNNAWIMDYTIVRKTSGKTANIKGELIYAYGKNSAYRLMLSSTEDNWKSNQKTWKKITSSIRIDQ